MVVIDNLVLQIMESTGLIPLDGDVAKITRHSEEFKDLHEALQRNLQTYLTLTMDAIAGIHQKIKASGAMDVSRQTVRILSGSLSNLRLTGCLGIECAAQEIAVAYDVCGYT
jgi:hypothetical protein